MHHTIRRVGTAYLVLSIWFVVTVAVSLGAYSLMSSLGLAHASSASMASVFGFGFVALGMIAATIVASLVWLGLRGRGSQEQTQRTQAADEERRDASLLPSR